MNDQRPWFTREDTGTIQFADDRQAAIRRVIARGSNPAAATEAESDFGPGGTFSLRDCLAGRTDPHQCDCTAPTCKDCGQPIRWTTDHWHHLTPLAVLRCPGREMVEPAPVEPATVHEASMGGF